jgi:sec-independent protein translocase protein TatA
MLSTHITLAISLPGPTELIVILVIVLVIFGGKNIPALGEGLGKGIKNFRRAIGGEKDEVEVVDAEVMSGDPKAKGGAPVSESERAELERRRLEQR